MAEMDYIIVPRIPRGLAPAVEGLAREILRQRPRNIYAFAAEHFAELVKLRDKERTGEVVSKILQHKLLKKCDSIVDWAKLNNGNKSVDVDVAESRNDHFRNFHKYDNSISEESAMVRREAKKSTAWKIATRKAAPAASKRKGIEERTSSGSKSGWSINRTVKALKQRHEYRAISSDIEQKYEGDCNKGLNGKETEKVVADYADYPDHPDHPDHRSPRFSSKDPFVRSSSAGNIMYAKRVKSREVGEDLEKFDTTVATLDDKSYRNEKNLTRQKSADQIERTCMYFKDVWTNEDAADILDADIADRKRRSRSLVNNEGRNESNVRQKARRQHATEGRMARNLKDEWKSVMEDQRKEQETFREKFPEAKEDDAKLNLQLEKRNEKASNEMEEILVNVESRLDLLKSNTMFDDSTTNEIPNVSGTTVSVVLPLVVGRQSSGKCTTRNNVVRERCEYESNGGEDGAGNFTLPPISNDGAKSTRKGSNLIELPSLSNDVDARSNEQAIHHRHHCEDSTNSSRIQKRSDSEKELFKLEGVTAEIAVNSDYSRKAIEKSNCKGQDARGDVNVHDIVSRKYPRESKSVEGSEVLLTTGKQVIEQDIDEITQIPQQSGIIQVRPSSSSSEEAGEIRETSKDSLSVTPDSIDLSSEKTNSSKRLGSEKKNGEKEEEENRDEMENERQEQCTPEPNELERKLIEIETMEKSIENTLVSSRSTISNDFDNEFGESERSIEFPTRNFEPDCARNEQVKSRVNDEWTKKNSDKSEKSATSNDESNGDNDDNVEIDSIGNETSIRKRSNFDNSDNSETLINEDNNDDSDDSTNVREIERCSQSTRGIDVSCYVLTEGSPCEIPETVTTVIIPDKIVDNDDNNVCKIELDDSTALDQFEIPSTGNGREIETNKEGKHGEEEHCQDQNLFGEYIGPETVVRYSSSVDAHFLRDVKDAADRVSAYQAEDLANIKEEEENEDEQFSKGLQRSRIVDRLHRGRIVDTTLEKSAETLMKLKKSIECKAKLTGSSRDQRLETSKMDSKEEETSPYALSNISDRPSSKHDYNANAEHIAKNDNSTTTKNREEEERKTFFDDRSSDVSLSFEQVGPTINVPELNLDSLQDVTISSTIGESDSKNRLSNENGNVIISSEDENISLSSFDALASSDNERKPNEPNDETLSFGNDRARLFSEPVTKVTGNETEGCSKYLQRAEKFSMKEKDDESEEESRYVEEEIARELIRNLIVDNTKQVVESNGSTTSSSSPKPQANNTKSNQAEDFVIQFHPSVQNAASKVAIGEISSYREKLDNDTRAEEDCGREKDEETSEEGRRRRRESGQEAKENEASILPAFFFLFFFAPPLLSHFKPHVAKCITI
ncbi:hypothetical protein K0M31_015169 [Melipona bicolor]|uniref:RIIa domain-containing protein n=1 Tax=Melipona bicolor TaxID=60889 RepID=A0AA40FG96_9HYME|nr:hypothetical protein K0M31_015169 [Melipona bicolor]